MNLLFLKSSVLCNITILIIEMKSTIFIVLVIIIQRVRDLRVHVRILTIQGDIGGLVGYVTAFGSGHDPRVLGLSLQSKESASPSPPCLCSLK